ncbi:MAG: methylenetetrahydrofolate--tRNA-(uracil(54)-C(5))-methyltransferase (FADH(2)-oxidizing) TrmFO [Proteobacteria bacterium]|nr:methylenetetrahydrofolate--tRNA-(uracil(54)-C(5))-methyltransferase (FADH(2)-oxidizing) TrmFO [Pseudomonadota bacterium]NDC24429.1 methylenetetrahydrofolate--tRNA-(uracil(54)-C(5))-methyltransferase (FADH(2)-oxidizing) TrmFO [Pseudomonadota bacterium]NDD04399.1 methylenetetrahydrofolate--tRNA-(uracil(54)-C(5))-methyltransferase (FADH(2)-oxidizing) TrmFO [Pseudomonadota bacterium]NDG26881.1 methylenetetrahydrofolate--tRNA-(uracil(54)-C(5))-methyltransferase (FADH(2)-oxidizing) TrmFO [Pseudomon
MSQKEKITVIGAGLAGSEAAWQIAKRGISVDLFEMRPVKMTPAHKSGHFSELVCSNSFGSDAPHSASRILKDELLALGSLTLRLAREFSVPAGASLAVDREQFSQAVTEELKKLPQVQIKNEELKEIPPKGLVIVATGPLTTSSLAQSLQNFLGGDSLYFYDAISPIVSADSLDFSKMFFGNRYDKGETADFLNIPLTQEQYESLVHDLLTGDVVLPHDFEEEKYFEGCMPIEALAARGPRTLAFGPMKPVGLVNPQTGKRGYAVIQLRAENKHKTAFNLVGFQTKLRYKEQERIFRKLPGLENAEFLRLGSMHRNTYIDSPRHLLPTLQLKRQSRIFIAGQLTGTEGYLESSAGGLIAGVNAARIFDGAKPHVLPSSTMLGSLLAAITDENRKPFQPMNVNMGILPPLSEPITRDKKLRNERYSNHSGQTLNEWLRVGSWVEPRQRGGL